MYNILDSISYEIQEMKPPAADSEARALREIQTAEVETVDDLSGRPVTVDRARGRPSCANKSSLFRHFLPGRRTACTLL